MGPQDTEEETQRVLIDAAMIASDIACEDAWLRYFGLGGTLDDFDIDGFLAGLISLPLTECNLLAHAVNELIEEQPPHPKAPYRTSRFEPVNTGGRDDVLDELLRQWLFGSTDRTHRQRDA
ncbi:hypothetical protein [Arthrobacter agilis]|uniref:hypothetical protein n=1 Tax=Arthrobacter agilis TaxID=37921 RepID=UPI002783CC6B|nr:hypothetical protein [Arthrobacter agilis]MDQ0734726.1 hypothetical protein [Arthrobacter agilis]